MLTLIYHPSSHPLPIGLGSSRWPSSHGHKTLFRQFFHREFSLFHHLWCVSFELCSSYFGHPYHEQFQHIYHAHSHQYHLTQDGHAYVLICSSLKYPPILEGQAVVFQVSLNKSLSLCLVTMNHKRSPLKRWPY